MGTLSMHLGLCKQGALSMHLGLRNRGIVNAFRTVQQVHY